MEFHKHFLSTSVFTVLSSRQGEKLQMEENPKQENASAKSDAGKIGLEVVASKEEGGLTVDHVGHMADTCNTPFIAPLPQQFITDPPFFRQLAPAFPCLRDSFFCRRLFCHAWQTRRAREVTPVPPQPQQPSVSDWWGWMSKHPQFPCPSGRVTQRCFTLAPRVSPVGSSSSCLQWQQVDNILTVFLSLSYFSNFPTGLHILNKLLALNSLLQNLLLV